MKAAAAVGVCVAVLLCVSVGHAAVANGVVKSVAFSNLEEPVDMEFLPGGRVLIVNRAGTILIADPSTKATAVYMKLSSVDYRAEIGLLDLALDPDFSSNSKRHLPPCVCVRVRVCVCETERERERKEERGK